MAKIQMAKSLPGRQAGKIQNPILSFIICHSFAIWALSFVICLSGCAKKSPYDAGFAKGYFKDRVALVPGASEGVGPTLEEAPAEKIIDLGRREAKGYDFGDESLKTLTIKSWEALNDKDENAVLVFTQRCIELYADEAKKQSAKLSDYPDGANIDSYQQLNYIGACYFIRGEFFKYIKDWPKAIQAYQVLVENFPFAQYWDPRGWYYKPAEIAKEEIRKINEGYYK